MSQWGCVNCAVCVYPTEFVSVSDSKSRFLLKRFKVSISVSHHVCDVLIMFT